MEENTLILIIEFNETCLEQMNILMRIIQLNVDYDNAIITMMALLSKNIRHSRMDGYLEWIDNYLNYDFFSLFRMSRATFSILLGKIDCEELHKYYTGGEQQIAAEKQLLMTLWWLGKGEVLLSVSDKFNVSVSSVFHCTTFIINRILLLLNEYILWPDIREIETVENDFRARIQYPGVIGAIDVCNIPFKAPLQFQESYIDRKLQHSIKLQAISTASKVFTNISVGFPGSAHDTRVLRNSEIYREVVEYGNYKNYFYNDDLHIVGDSAYPLSNWLITPYRDNGNLNERERRHNYCHSKTRVVVEHTFGILKSRWRILKYINVNCVQKAVKIIAVCCILHNFCYVNSDFWDDYEEVENDEDDNEIGRDMNVLGIRKRNNIADYLYNP